MSGYLFIYLVMIPVPICRVERCNSFNILLDMLEHFSSPAKLSLCSYAIAESWLRRLALLKKKGKINYIKILLDEDVIIRHREKLFFIQNICDEIYFSSSHAKVIILENETTELLAIMSCNATNNYRIETYYITNNHEDIERIRGDLNFIFRRNSKSIG